MIDIFSFDNFFRDISKTKSLFWLITSQYLFRGIVLASLLNRSNYITEYDGMILADWEIKNCFRIQIYLAEF